MVTSFTDLVSAMTMRTEGDIAESEANEAATIAAFNWRLRCVRWSPNPYASTSASLGRADIMVDDRLILQGITVRRAPDRLVLLMPLQHQSRESERRPPPAVWFSGVGSFRSFTIAGIAAIREAYPDALPASDSDYFADARARERHYSSTSETANPAVVVGDAR
jgi:hypothetical protein